MISSILPLLLAQVALTSAGALRPRTVTALDANAVAEAQQRDDTATRAFSNVQITTSDGRCLSVDKLSGDFRENLTPIQVTDCGSTDGQGWDIITAGKHNNAANAMIVVSTLTQACLNLDPRRAAGNQVLLFSCGGRADGSGEVANSQLFPFNGTAGPLSFAPENSPGSCLAVNGNVLDVANCDSADTAQAFVFGSTASVSASATATKFSSVLSSSSAPATSSSSGLATPPAPATSSAISACRPRTRTVFATAKSSASSASTSAPVSIALGAAVVSPLVSLSSAASSVATNAAAATSGAPVSRGGTLNPSAAAEANPRDDTATRNLTDVTIRAPNGQCIFVDPTAGDFRENLLPVGLQDCAGTPNERWDIITAGAHNNVPGTALVVSTLTNGCISFDGRRPTNDTVTVFSCGGRADGSGQTTSSQLMPFIGAFSFAFAPVSDNGDVCLLPGDGRLVSGACPTNGGQLFAVFP